MGVFSSNRFTLSGLSSACAAVVLLTAAGMAPADAFAQTTTTTWSKCANEGQTCSFSGTKTVRYGLSGKYATRTVTGPVSCSNSTFGDPYPGADKICEVATTTTTGTTTTPTPTPTTSTPTTSTSTTWTKCANEGSTCSYTGTKTVRYGLSGKYATRSVAGPVACNNSTFGDPYPGADKICEIASTTTTTTPTPTSTAPTPTPTTTTPTPTTTTPTPTTTTPTPTTTTPTPTPTTTTPTPTTTTPTPTTTTTWNKCADEGGSCSFSGTKQVRYGLNSSWAVRSATGSIACTNEVFGDPMPGADKVCQVQTTTTSTTTTPTPTPTPTTTTPTPTPTPTTSTMTPYGQDASAYTLTFSEEFNSWNSARWNDKIWYESGNATKNYTVEDGKLKIWPQRDASGSFFNRTIDTDGKYYQTYGYFEMEAKLPRGKGTWPAFWLFNHIGSRRPEMDIMEAYAGGNGWGYTDSSGVAIPTTYAATVWKGDVDGQQVGFKMHNAGVDLSAGFHKYAVKWEPNKQTYYFDGKAILTVNTTFSDPMYIMLDLWFGSASGTPDNSTPQGKTNSYEVNYVRAWQFK